MEEWKAATREQERRLWSTLSWVGVTLTVVLVGSIAVGAADTEAPSSFFFVQQALLLALSAVGTAVAARRWMVLRHHR